MKQHAGVEKRGRDRLTICGIVVGGPWAPLKQPVRNISCLRCRRSILATWKAAIMDRNK